MTFFSCLPIYTKVTSVPTPKASSSAAIAENAATLQVPPAIGMGQKRNSLKDQYGIDPNDPAVRALQQLQPKKSILKKSASYTIHAMTDSSRPKLPMVNPSPRTTSADRQKSQTLGPDSTYKTVTGTESSR